MNERENEYRGCRLHRYLVAEATPTERQALHMTGWIAAFGIFAWIGGLMDR